MANLVKFRRLRRLIFPKFAMREAWLRAISHTTPARHYIVMFASWTDPLRPLRTQAVAVATILAPTGSAWQGVARFARHSLPGRSRGNFCVGARIVAMATASVHRRSLQPPYLRTEMRAARKAAQQARLPAAAALQTT